MGEEDLARRRVYVTRRIPAAGLRQLAEAGVQVEVWPGALPPPRAALLEQVRGRDGLICLLTDRVDDQLLDAAGDQLRVVSNHAVGYDNVDVPACTRRGVLVTNTPEVLTETTADLAFALLLAAGRRLVEGVDHVRAGRWLTWDPCFLLGQDIHGATLGLVGLGRIGRAVARRAAGFGMRVLAHDPSHALADAAAAGVTPCATLAELLAAADFVSLHVPYGPATHHLIDATALRAMKPTAVLVNTSRGPVVDPAALLQALQQGWIFAAGLDVTEPEPLPADHPLLQLPNCTVLPHVASASVATRDRMAALAVTNLLAALRGERPPELVNPAAWPGRVGRARP